MFIYLVASFPVLTPNPGQTKWAKLSQCYSSFMTIVSFARHDLYAPLSRLPQCLSVCVKQRNEKGTKRTDRPQKDTNDINSAEKGAAPG